ncbi:ferritin-like metal-binding protein YciE [Chitinophaga skermanii]|uniref:Ferritin-like metal-binding protein YciE n=1 Tax=Chitinophaga skermanii TaxID=331697 RepID=A0A327Q7U9_9BACT|nr:DUF892 family protein [Chitinophaga skermanii]RAI97856.1 ferritin-like metal-binding protein YciE [Chitinophaga skermanii]
MTSWGHDPLLHSQDSGSTLLHQLFVREMRCLYWTALSLVDQYKQWEEIAEARELKRALAVHNHQTKQHVNRIESVLQHLDLPLAFEESVGMKGLIKEARRTMSETKEKSAQRDAALILCWQRIEHYEIATYGGLVTFAETLQYHLIADILRETLKEEKEMDEQLSAIAARYINTGALQETV